MYEQGCHAYSDDSDHWEQRHGYSCCDLPWSQRDAIMHLIIFGKRKKCIYIQTKKHIRVSPAT
eukprot:XP_001706632.1 Hypothetical protein GL50803_26412 [Giardia lamblia ATCC 50803]